MAAMLFYGTLRQTAILLAFLALTANSVCADEDPKGAEVLAKYLSSMEVQREALRGTISNVTLEGSLPRLKKQGRMDVLRRVSRLGEITYKMLGFTGDNTIKKEVIGQYLTAETEAQTKTDPASISITPANYNFRYKGLQQRHETSSMVHVFELKPKQKRVGLFKGELWIDPETNLPVRETGRLVRTPSIFLKRIQFVREYQIVDGVARPVRIESMVDTRIAGKALLAINFANYRRDEPVAADATAQ
ncbi:MAG TPA: hypothetical protein VFL57_09570 [Bryobacteraceae bacterium]|nr:hypothetical protein [Bryobacteraceae bacterium]